MEIVEKMTQFLENTIETVPPEQFLFIFFVGIIWIYIMNFVGSIGIAIENKIWLVKDYEEIIHKCLGTYDAEDYKHKKLIANAKENTERRIKCLKRRKAIKEKIKRLFKKGNKNGEK